MPGPATTIGASAPPAPTPASKIPINPQTHLRVYVLPTLHSKYAFHPRFLKPRSRVNHFALIASYILRKWRYQISDVGAFAWHGLGGWSAARQQSVGGKLGAAMWRFGNRITTRRAADEYFLKGVPRITEHVEFIYPASANTRLIKNQIGEFLANGDRHRNKLFLWALILPSALYISKFHVSLANILFTYNIFRLNASWRAMYGAKTLQRLVDSKQVTWNASADLDELVQRFSQDVTKRMEAETNGQGRVWRWNRDGDLHDDVLEALEKELKCVELARTYRRTRMQYLVHGPKEI